MDKAIIMDEHAIRDLQAQKDILQSGFACSCVALVICMVIICGEYMVHQDQLKAIKIEQGNLRELYVKELNRNKVLRENYPVCPEVDLKKDAPKRVYIIRI